MSNMEYSRRMDELLESLESIEPIFEPKKFVSIFKKRELLELMLTC